MEQVSKIKLVAYRKLMFVFTLKKKIQVIFSDLI